MCQIVNVAAIQHETQELLEEMSPDRFVSVTLANELERSWESEAYSYEDEWADSPSIELFV